MTGDRHQRDRRRPFEAIAVSAPVGWTGPIVPIEEIEETARRLRPELARVVRFKESGHGTVGVQDAVLELVRDFVLERS